MQKSEQLLSFLLGTGFLFGDAFSKEDEVPKGVSEFSRLFFLSTFYVEEKLPEIDERNKFKLIIQSP